VHWICGGVTSDPDTRTPAIQRGVENEGFAANFVYNKIFGTLNYPFAAVLCIVLVAIASLFVFVVFKLYGTGTLGVEVGEE